MSGRSSSNPYSDQEIILDVNSSGIGQQVQVGSADNAVQAQYIPADVFNEAQEYRDDFREIDQSYDEELNMRQADALRTVPRLREDNINPNKARKLQDPGVQRKYLSSRMQKEYSKNKNAWAKELPKVRAHAIKRTIEDPRHLDNLNRALMQSQGDTTSMGRNTGKRVRDVDRAIQDYERANDRDHIIYSKLRAPESFGQAAGASVVRDYLQGMVDYNENPNRPTLAQVERQGLDPNEVDYNTVSHGTFTFDSYIPATHSIGNLPDDGEIVMEIHTRSGAYIGGSDSRPQDADHIMGRGRTLQPVAVNEVEYLKPDGTTGKRWVVQMEDVTNDGRTTAR